MCLEIRVKIPEWRHDFARVYLLLTFNRSWTFIWCFRRWLWLSKCWLSRWIIERNLFWTRSLTLAHLHKSISPSEAVIFNWLEFRIKIIFTKSISGVGLKLVKMKNRTTKSGHDCYTNIHCTFSQVFFSKHF